MTPEGALAEEVPYQGTDVRLLRGFPKSDSRWERKPSELLEPVRECISQRGQAAVIYVNTPVVASEPGAGGGQASLESVISLIKTVASESQRDVVLALDLAQVDSDRDLGVFGNSPYHGLADQMRDMPSRAKKHLGLDLVCSRPEELEARMDWASRPFPITSARASKAMLGTGMEAAGEGSPRQVCTVTSWPMSPPGRKKIAGPSRPPC